MRRRVQHVLSISILAAAAGCAHLRPMESERAVEIARRSVCGAPGTVADEACQVREYQRIRGGYRVLVERRPPAGDDRVLVTVRGGLVDVEPAE